MPLWLRVSRIWLPVAVAVTVLAALIHVSVQQAYRNGADDPQTQLAQDGAAALDAGAQPRALVELGSVALDKSLAPFVIVISPTDTVLASNASLNGSSPKPPAGVLAVTRAAGHDRVTWEPRPGVRIAAVSYAAQDGRVVVSGRSLRDVERHEDDLSRIVMVGWGIAELATLLMALGVELVAGRYQVRPTEAA